jgi:hypothetical protein
MQGLDAPEWFGQVTAPIRVEVYGPPPAVANLAAAAQGFDVTLTWTDNSATESGFRIERLESGTWNQVGVVAANVTTFTQTVPGVTATYTYRVEALNDAGTSPPAQTSITVYSELPSGATAVSPLNCMPSLRPTLTWNAPPRATRYHVAVTRADDDAFFVNAPNVASTAYGLTSDLAAGVLYRWKVRACNNIGCGPWSPSMFFKPMCSPLPNMTSPLGCIGSQVPVFQWTASPGATSYWLLVGSSPDFSATTTTRYVDVNTGATSYAPGIAFSSAATYYAKVKSLGGNHVGWSTTIAFRPLCPDTSPP